MIFLVESPFQLLSAIEAANHFGATQNILIIRYTGVSNTDEQLDRVSNLFRWNNIIRLRFFINLSISEVLALFKIKRIIRKISKIDAFFIGEPRSFFMQAVIGRIEALNYFFLDDGVSTPGIFNRLRATNFDYTSVINENEPIYSLKRLIYRMMRFSNAGQKKIGWFTCFDIQPIANEKVIVHEFNYLKKSRTSADRCTTPKKDYIYFIGSNLSGVDIISFEEEIKLINLVANELSKEGNKIIYCVHRREDDKKISTIESIENVITRRAEYPLEIDFLLNAVDVENLVSFYSSAIKTLAVIYKPDNVWLYRVPSELLNKKYLKGVENAYLQFEREGFQIRPIIL